jgi:uncharacterized protein (TIRG00374 family)
LVIPLIDSANNARSNPKQKFWRSRVIRLAGSALILTLLLTVLPFHQVWSAMKRIPPALALGLLCAYLVLHLLGVVKWRLLINTAGADLTFFQSVRCYYGGLFGNIFLPSLVGGDLVRGGMAFLVSRSRAAIVLGSLTDRVQDVLGLLGVTTIGVLLLPTSLDYQSHKRLWAVGITLLVAGALGLASLLVLPARKFPFRIRRIMAKLRRGLRSMYGRPGRMLTAFSLGMALQVCQAGINYRLGAASGLHLTFNIWLFAWPLAKLSALVPITQGGIGVREAVLVGLLAPLGAPPAFTAAAGLLFQAIVISGGLLAGLIALLMGQFSSASAKRPQYAPEFARDGFKTRKG